MNVGLTWGFAFLILDILLTRSYSLELARHRQLRSAFSDNTATLRASSPLDTRVIEFL